jgi:hypothetical protein
VRPGGVVVGRVRWCAGKYAGLVVVAVGIGS